MKICPACNRIYPEDAFFCMKDGHALIDLPETTPRPEREADPNPKTTREAVTAPHKEREERQARAGDGDSRQGAEETPTPKPPSGRARSSKKHVSWIKSDKIKDRKHVPATSPAVADLNASQETSSPFIESLEESFAVADAPAIIAEVRLSAIRKTSVIRPKRRKAGSKASSTVQTDEAPSETEATVPPAPPEDEENEAAATVPTTMPPAPPEDEESDAEDEEGDAEDEEGDAEDEEGDAEDEKSDAEDEEGDAEATVPPALAEDAKTETDATELPAPPEDEESDAKATVPPAPPKDEESDASEEPRDSAAQTEDEPQKTEKRKPRRSGWVTKSLHRARQTGRDSRRSSVTTGRSSKASDESPWILSRSQRNEESLLDWQREIRERPQPTRQNSAPLRTTDAPLRTTDAPLRTTNAPLRGRKTINRPSRRSKHRLPTGWNSLRVPSQKKNKATSSETMSADEQGPDETILPPIETAPPAPPQSAEHEQGWPIEQGWPGGDPDLEAQDAPVVPPPPSQDVDDLLEQALLEAEASAPEFDVAGWQVVTWPGPIEQDEDGDSAPLAPNSLSDEPQAPELSPLRKPEAKKEDRDEKVAPREERQKEERQKEERQKEERQKEERQREERQGEDSDPQGLRPGSLCEERFEIQRLIGEGNLGRVYAARDRQDGERVALRMLHPWLSARPRSQVYLDDLQALGSLLQSPMVSRLLHVGRHQGQLFMTSRLFKGHHLAQIIAERGPLKLQIVGRIITKLLTTLEDAHAVGLIHGDLQLRDLIILDDPSIAHFLRIINFGLWALPSEQDRQLLQRPIALAPEQIEHKQISPQTDFYALGCLIFELLAGRPPFVLDRDRPIAEALETLQAQHLRQEPPALDQYSHEPLMPGLVDLVYLLLAKDPDQRPSSIDELRALLRRAGRGERIERPIPPRQLHRATSETSSPLETPQTMAYGQDTRQELRRSVQRARQERAASRRKTGSASERRADPLDLEPIDIEPIEASLDAALEAATSLDQETISDRTRAQNEVDAEPNNSEI